MRFSRLFLALICLISASAAFGTEALIEGEALYFRSEDLLPVAKGASAGLLNYPSTPSGFPLVSAPLFNSDYVQHAIAVNSTTNSPGVVKYRLHIDNSHKGNYFVVSNPGNHTHVFPPVASKCGARVTVLANAKINHCILATNAGFFDVSNGDCLGNLVSDHTVILKGPNPNANFGIRDNQFVIGYVAPEEVDSKFQTLVAGVGWLVRGGKSNLAQATKAEHLSQSFIDLLAPRIGVGINQYGQLIILEVNGYEPAKQGFTLNQLEALALKVGAVDFINLDGGGSVSVIYEQLILNTCSDGCPASGGTVCGNGKCLRAVTSYLCFK